VQRGILLTFSSLSHRRRMISIRSRLLTENVLHRFISLATMSTVRRSSGTFIIGVAGGTASGKSSVCARIMERLGDQHQRRVITLAQDSFYRELSADENARALKGEFNFDHPDAFEHQLMLSTLNDLRNGKGVRVPKYDFRTNSRVIDEFDTLDPADVILVEGILIFFDPNLRDMFNMKLFVDTDSDIRLARRVERDTAERGRTLSQVLSQYLTTVKPAFEEFCLPTKKYADVVIPRGAENDVAIDLIVQHIQDLLRSPSSNSISSSVGAVKQTHTSVNGVGAKETNTSRKVSSDQQSFGRISRPH